MNFVRVDDKMPPLGSGESRRFERWNDRWFGLQLWVVVTQPNGWEDWMLGCNHVSQPVKASTPNVLSVFCQTTLANTA